MGPGPACHGAALQGTLTGETGATECEICEAPWRLKTHNSVAFVYCVINVY